MDPWLRIAGAIAFGYALDRAFVWMARRGWIYWRGFPTEETRGHRMALATGGGPTRRPGVVRRDRLGLVTCRDCGYLVSLAALACPSCGRVLRPAWLVGGALLVACLAVYITRMVERLHEYVAP